MVNIFKLFAKKKEITPQQTGKTEEPAEIPVYSGMRVEVVSQEGQFLFIARLAEPKADTVGLHLYSEADISPEEPLPVQIRGYSDYEKKAVFLKGVAMPEEEKLWRATGLLVDQVKNERAFFRLTVNLDASLTAFRGVSAGEAPCRVLNISVGGAGIRSKERYSEGDKLLLKVRLLEDTPESVLYCQVLRVDEKEDNQFEYGCQFLGMTEEGREQITQNIFAVQRQKRKRT